VLDDREEKRIKTLEEGVLTLKLWSETTQEHISEIKSDVKDIKESVANISTTLLVNEKIAQLKDQNNLWPGIRKNTANLFAWIAIIFMFFMVVTHLSDFKDWKIGEKSGAPEVRAEQNFHMNHIEDRR